MTRDELLDCQLGRTPVKYQGNKFYVSRIPWRDGDPFCYLAKYPEIKYVSDKGYLAKIDGEWFVIDEKEANHIAVKMKNVTSLFEVE